MTGRREVRVSDKIDVELLVDIWMDDDGRTFIAGVPALPGCLSQGRTYEEALANIKEAAEGVLLVQGDRNEAKRREERDRQK